MMKAGTAIAMTEVQSSPDGFHCLHPDWGHGDFTRLSVKEDKLQVKVETAGVQGSSDRLIMGGESQEGRIFRVSEPGACF